MELDGPARGFDGVFLLAEAAGHITGQFAKDKRLLEKNPGSQSMSRSPTRVTHRQHIMVLLQFLLQLWKTSPHPQPSIPMDKYVLLISKRGFK